MTYYYNINTGKKTAQLPVAVQIGREVYREDTGRKALPKQFRLEWFGLDDLFQLVGIHSSFGHWDTTPFPLTQADVEEYRDWANN